MSSQYPSIKFLNAALITYFVLLLSYHSVMIYFYAPISEMPPILANWMLAINRSSGFVEWIPFVDVRRDKMIEAGNFGNYFLLMHLYAASLYFSTIGFAFCLPLYKRWSRAFRDATLQNSTSPRQALVKNSTAVSAFAFIVACAVFGLVLDVNEIGEAGWLGDHIIENKWHALRILIMHLFLFIGGVGLIATLLARRSIASDQRRI